MAIKDLSTYKGKNVKVDVNERIFTETENGIRSQDILREYEGVIAEVNDKFQYIKIKQFAESKKRGKYSYLKTLYYPELINIELKESSNE